METKKIRLGLVGVGNCAASLVEGIVFTGTGKPQTGSAV